MITKDFTTVKLNTYTIKIVVIGDGFGGTDLYYTSSETMEFITDQIEFYLSGSEDGRINVNDTGVVWWNARYDYDNTSIIVGLTAQLNGSKNLLWDSINTRWYYQEMSETVTRIGYRIISAFESDFDLTGWVQSAANISIIWDQIVVRSYAIVDSRVDIDILVTINVTLEYDYDDSDVVNGVVLIQSVSAAYVENGVWQIIMVKSSVQNVTFNSVICSGNTLGQYNTFVLVLGNVTYC